MFVCCKISVTLRRSINAIAFTLLPSFSPLLSHHRVSAKISGDNSCFDGEVASLENKRQQNVTFLSLFKVLLLDSDAVFMTDVVELWRHFDRFGKYQVRCSLCSFTNLWKASLGYLKRTFKAFVALISEG